MDEDNKRNCYKCQFFYVTWEPAHPNGCRALGFKSRQLPCITVFQSSGKPCEYFKEKKK
ncbi:MAG TPA: uracil-DNA glycosylase [Desulfobacter sp.]|nr:uracil-DNA glycosylase [Desulfobacter sp.]HBT88650.1 uracil-DNA glycosylase [Desulfobacter sp.]